jgi:hypothetical protein
MATDVKKGLNDASSQIISYGTTISVQETEKKLKKLSNGNNFELSKSESVKQLNAIGDVKQRAQTEIKNQFEELIDLFKLSMPSKPGINSKSIDFLLKQILLASQNTKSRISEVLVEESMKVAGCSQEQTFEGNDDNDGPNKLYVRVNQIDLFKLLKKDPEEGFNSILYESTNPVNGSQPYSMDKELYNRLQNEGFSFNDEYGSDYIGSANSPIMNITYVTSYVKNGTTYYGNFYEITLRNRPNLNRVSDFLKDYYNSIDFLNFDGLSVKIMNSLTNFIDISGNLSINEKEEQSKFEKIVQRILGLCFDNNKEIDVSGNAKNSALDTINESFFEMSPIDLRNIENNVNNMVNGVTEFEDCNNVKVPVNVQSISKSIGNMSLLPDNEKIDYFIQEADNMSKDENWKLLLPDSLNINVSIKSGILKVIPQAVVLTILSPKVLLGLMVILKSLGSTIIDEIEGFDTFMRNMKTFLINLVSRIGAIFIEELFMLLKANLRALVETLLIEVVKESKNASLSIVTSIIYALIQVASGIVDWRQCKSVVDEILNLLKLIPQPIPGIPNFALSSARLLPGYSPTRAMALINENLQKLGLPTGDMPDGSPNLMLPSMFQQLKGSNQENLNNSKTEIYVPATAVAAFAGGVTFPVKAFGKSY